MKSAIIGNRIRQFLKDKGLTQKELARQMKDQQSNISDMLSGKRDIDKLIGFLGMNYIIDPDYFTNGVMIDGKTQEMRPHYTAFVEAGTKTEENSGEVEMRPVVWHIPKYDFTIQVHGRSMEPLYKHGDVVACLDVTHSTYLEWGRVHVLSTSHGNMIKRIYDDGERIECVSLNEEYKPFSIPKNEIYSIGMVVGGIKIEE